MKTTRKKRLAQKEISPTSEKIWFQLATLRPDEWKVTKPIIFNCSKKAAKQIFQLLHSPARTYLNRKRQAKAVFKCTYIYSCSPSLL